MATLHDPEVKQDEEFDDLTEAQEASSDPKDVTPVEPTQDEVVTEEEVAEVPDKYKGKSSAEIIRMHQEAEKMAGKQSSEVGELRKIVDTFIQGQVESRQEESTTDEEVDFFDDPKAAVAKAVANHPSIKAAEATTAGVAQSQAVASLQARHPDMQEILASDTFGKWVTASPLRMRLYDNADTKFDLDAANELMEMYKERQALNTAVVATEEKERKRVVKQAATGGARGSAATKSKKIYRRADIIKLMQDNPKRYEAMQEEIMQAYVDKRVR